MDYSWSSLQPYKVNEGPEVPRSNQEHGRVCSLEAICASITHLTSSLFMPVVHLTDFSRNPSPRFLWPSFISTLFPRKVQFPSVLTGLLQPELISLPCQLLCPSPFCCAAFWSSRLPPDHFLSTVLQNLPTLALLGSTNVLDILLCA